MRYDIGFYILLGITYIFMFVITSDTHKEDGADIVVSIIACICPPLTLLVFSVIGIIDKYRKAVRE